jgi:hypothetical protein
MTTTILVKQPPQEPLGWIFHGLMVGIQKVGVIEHHNSLSIRLLQINKGSQYLPFTWKVKPLFGFQNYVEKLQQQKNPSFYVVI